jgi:hypothetical protein
MVSGNGSTRQTGIDAVGSAPSSRRFVRDVVVPSRSWQNPLAPGTVMSYIRFPPNPAVVPAGAEQPNPTQVGHWAACEAIQEPDIQRSWAPTALRPCTNPLRGIGAAGG